MKEALSLLMKSRKSSVEELFWNEAQSNGFLGRPGYVCVLGGGWGYEEEGLSRGFQVHKNEEKEGEIKEGGG